MYSEHDKKSILRYWEMLQVYRPYHKAEGLRFDCSRTSDDKPLMPWENSRTTNAEYCVYIGNYNVCRLGEAAYKNRQKSMPQEETDMLEGKKTHLCIFKVDSRGRLKKGTFKIVPFMFLMGFVSRDDAIGANLDESLILQKNKNFADDYKSSQCLTFRDFEKIDRDLLTSLGFSISDFKNKSSNITTVYVKEQACTEDQENSSQSDSRSAAGPDHVHERRRSREIRRPGAFNSMKEMLPESSFVVNMLEEAMDGQDSVMVDALLEDMQEPVSDLADFITQLDPAASPLGKWPGSEPLDLLQQHAVNYIMDRNNESPVKVINAPAGTDREGIIKAAAAAQIVEKARFLAGIEKPDSIFTADSIEGEDFFRVPEELKNTEVVVLTDRDSRAYSLAGFMTRSHGESLSGDFTASDKNYGIVNDIYYTRAAKNIFDEKETWGLPVLYIGSRNRIGSTTETLYDDINELQSNFHTKKLMDLFDFIGVRELCEAMFRKIAAEQEWADIRKEFTELYKSLDNIRHEAGTRYSSVCDIPEVTPDDLKEELDELRLRMEEIQDHLEDLEEEIAELEYKHDQADQEADDVYEELSSREQRLYKILKTPAVNKYNRLLAKSEKIDRDIDRKKEEAVRARERLQAASEKYSKFNGKMEKAEEWSADHISKMEEIRNLYNSANITDYRNLKEIYEYLYTSGKEIDEPLKEASDLDLMDADLDSFDTPQKKKGYKPGSSLDRPPFMSRIYLETSEKLLFKALQLMKTFIRSSDKAKKNINLLLKIINSGNIIKTPAEIFDNAFASFQLMIPVITIPKEVFQGLLSADGKTDMGTIIIADAAAWSPEDAFQPLITAENLVLMGDPKSEKITSRLPFLAEDYLLSVTDMPDIFRERGMSIYHAACADSDSRALKLILAHNCERKLLRFTNQSYDIPVLASPATNPSDGEYSIPESCFMDIRGKTVDKNSFYVEEQGKVVISLLNRIISLYGINFFSIPNDDIFITSPYTSVVEGLRNLINTKLIAVLPAASELISSGEIKHLDISNFLFRFKNENIITLDEFDRFGRAREMILVLGCDRTSYGSFSAGNDIRILNRMFSGISGRLAIIGSSAVWGSTKLYKMIENELEIIKVE